MSQENTKIGKYEKYELCEHLAPVEEITTRRCEDCRAVVENSYESFWKDLVETDGEPDMDKIKAELSDYEMVMENVTEVYLHLTNGNFSKPNYESSVIINEVEKIHNKEIEEAKKEVREEEVEELLDEARGRILDEIRAIYKQSSTSSDFCNKIRAWLPDEEKENDPDLVQHLKPDQE